MKLWQRRALGILAVGGGSIGASQCLAAMMSAGRVVEWILIFIALAFYSFGVAIGVRLIEGRPSAERGNRAFWILQVPTFSTPWLGYFFSSGFHVTLKLEFAPFQFGANFLLGSTFNFSLLQGDAPIFIGFNAFALAIVVWLTSTFHDGEPAAVSSPP